MPTEPIRKRFTVTFDVVQSSPMYEDDPYTEMSDEQLLATLKRLFDAGVPPVSNRAELDEYKEEHPEWSGYMIDWGEPLSCMYGPEERDKFIPENTILNIETVSVELN